MNRREKRSFWVNILIVLLVAAGLIYMIGGPDAIGWSAFGYFTVQANALLGISAAVTASHTRQVLRGKRTQIPGGAEVLRFAAVTEVTFTAIVVLFILAPGAKEGFFHLYRGGNLLFHFLLPVLAAFDYLHLNRNPLPKGAGALLAPAVLPVLYILQSFRRAEDGGLQLIDRYDLFLTDAGVNISAAVGVAAILGAVVLLYWGIGSCRKAPGTGAQEDDGYEILTAREYYNASVLRFLCNTLPLVGLCAATLLTLLTLTGQSDMTFTQMLIFDACNLLYIPLTQYMRGICIGKNGTVINSRLDFFKNIYTAVLLLQWNMFSFFAPTRELWGYCFLFILMSAMLVDSRMVLVNEGLLFGSMVLSWWIVGDRLLPAREENFLPAMVLRVTAILLAFAMIYMLVRLIEKHILSAMDTASNIDPLTHAMTRRRMPRILDAAEADFVQKKVAYCIAIFDLDDFKKINDTYGHVAGDKVLYEFGRVLHASIQSEDSIFRYGGEEFLVLFRCPESYAKAACFRIIHRLAALSFPFLPENVHITATAGLAAAKKGDAWEKLVEEADARLYKGKHTGKNRVVSG